MDSSNACAQAGFSRISRVGTGGHGDVDLDDFAGIEACLLGPGGGLGAGCDCHDADDDADVDLADFNRFQAAFAGN